MVRIAAGRFRGRRLHVPAGRVVRPTADRVKVCIFDILQAIVAGARVLDAYAGAGGLGLEALSRGARSVVLVERDPSALAALRRNIEHLGVALEAEVVRGDALRYLAIPHPEPFDLVLADPPYVSGAEDAVLVATGGAALRDGGCLVLQHRRRWSAPEAPPGLRAWRSKRFGDTVVDFFIREEAERGSDRPDGPLSRHV
jgi:16S rRNA (guanine966-N2)-methyltransferase